MTPAGFEKLDPEESELALEGASIGLAELGGGVAAEVPTPLEAAPGVALVPLPMLAAIAPVLLGKPLGAGAMMGAVPSR
jgi:hypothetical protein